MQRTEKLFSNIIMMLQFNKTKEASKSSEKYFCETRKCEVIRSHFSAWNHLLHSVLFHINHIPLQTESSIANAEPPPLSSALFLQTRDSNYDAFALKSS